MADSVDALRRACREPLPHPDLDALQASSDSVRAFLLEHFATLPEQSIGRTGSRAELERLLREPPPEAGQGFDRAFADFRDKVYPFAFRPSHPRFVAFIPGAPNFVSVLGDWLCAGTNFFDGVWLEAAGPAQVELVVLDWFKEFLGYPAHAGGILTSGGSEANLTALVVARDRLPFRDRSRAILYETEHRHWSADRAARIIGLGPEQIRGVPADEQFRLRVDALVEAIVEDRRRGRLPWAVVANAGATNTGTIDPLGALAELCRRENLWFHVDAAYGWSAALTAEGKALLEGIGLADSITLDPHKWFGQPFGTGCILVRDGRLLPKTFSLRPEYMQDVTPADDQVNFADYGIALTRRFRALKIWLSLKTLGVAWFRQLVEHCCNLAALGEALLRRSGAFEILSPRQLSIVGFRYVPPHWPGKPTDDELDPINQAIFEALLATGRAFLSTTRLHGKVALRLCFVNWRTTAADVEEIVGLVEKIGRQTTEETIGRKVIQ